MILERFGEKWPSSGGMDMRSIADIPELSEIEGQRTLRSEKSGSCIRTKIDSLPQCKRKDMNKLEMQK